MKHSIDNVNKNAINNLLNNQVEDNIVIYTLLTMLVGYMGKVVYSDKDVEKHRMIVKTIFSDHNINTIDDLNKRMKECAEEVKKCRLNSLKPLKGIH